MDDTGKRDAAFTAGKWKDMGERDNKIKIKQICGLMVFAALLVLAVINSKWVFGSIRFLLEIISPFVVGGIIAFALNLPMRAIERGLFGKCRRKFWKACRRPVSMLLSIVVVGLIITLVIATVVPQLSAAVAVLGSKIPLFLDDAAKFLMSLSKKYPELKEHVYELQNVKLNWDAILDSAVAFLQSGVGSMLSSTVTVAGNILGGVVELVIAFIFALYILSQKEKLASQGGRVVTAYFSEKNSNRILRVLSMLHRNFSSFITGQCLEAVILGTMFVVAMSIFRMPYAFMVGVLIAFTALIPIVGAFIGCAVGAFLILIESPVLAFWFVVMFLILQQVEGNLIYPKVVGNSVGLPAIWVLVAVSLGGSLFGVAGMLFFIPLTATGYALFRENVENRNAKKAGTRSTKMEETAAEVETGEETKKVDDPDAEEKTGI